MPILERLKFRPTFRVKILLSLMGTVILLLVILLLVVRNEISDTTHLMTGLARERSNRAFTELEQLYSAELMRFSRRISEKNRVPAILQEAVEENDYQLLAEAAAYELNMAQIPLAVFTDETGLPVLTLLRGNVLKGNRYTLELLQQETNELLQKGIAADKRDIYLPSSYHIFQERLYTTRGIVLFLFGRPVGTVTIGFPVDDALTGRMGNVLHAEIGFIVKNHFLASTPMKKRNRLKEYMLDVAGKEFAMPVTLGDEQWIMLSEPLNRSAPERGNRVIAISLEEYLRPLYLIEKVFRWSGFVILLISTVLGISISRGLSAPVRELVNATHRVAAGNYLTTVDINTKDELSVLAESFNSMTHDLLLKEQYRGLLDKVVSPAVAEEMVRGNITLGGENRKVTTLFADIRGFTTITEGMEPQEVIAMLNEYVEYAGAAIEAEGGVVDKYVGDAIMAIFGAPVSHPDDSLRAIRAGLRIQENIQLLNYKRKNVGIHELHVGIGINTGIAVAGNMGSASRLNYTVLGESVNIASRLCNQANASEILITDQTLRETEDHVIAHEFKTISMKGFLKQVKVYKVEKIKEFVSPVIKRIHNMILILMLLFLLGNGFLHGVCTPLLSGLHVISKNGNFQMDFSGRLQMGIYIPQKSPSWLINKTSPFGTGRLSLYSDIFIGNHLYGLVEIRLDGGEIPESEALNIRIQQAFVRCTLLAGNNLHIQVGKFVSPFGDYNQRHDTAMDSFIRPPIIHEYRTMICPGIAPALNDGFIKWKYRPSLFRPSGAPIIWGNPYQAGVMIFGNFGKTGFRIAAMNSAPSSDPVQWDLNFDQNYRYSWVAHLDYRFSPELKIGFSYNRGPYSLESISKQLPGNTHINDYPQILWGVDITFTKGKFSLFAECIDDTWHVPNVIQYPKDLSYYLEMKYKLIPGLFVAVRYGAIHFNKIVLSTGEKEQWDFDVSRWQAAVGYRFSRRLDIRGEYMLNYTDGPDDPKDNLVALQLVWKF